MRLLKNFLTFLTRSRARKANVTDAREQVIADVTNHDPPLSRSQSSEKVSFNVQRRVSSRQSGGADSSRPSIALSIPEMIEKTRLMAQSIDEQSDAERPSKRAEITRTITSGRYRYKDAQGHTPSADIGPPSPTPPSLSVQDRDPSYDPRVLPYATHVPPSVYASSHPALSPVLEGQENVCDINKFDDEVALALSRRQRALKPIKTGSTTSPAVVPGRAKVSAADPARSPLVSSPRSISSRIHVARCKTARGTRSPIHSPLASPTVSLRSPLQAAFRSPLPHSPVRSVHRVARKPAHVLLQSPTRSRRNPHTLEPPKHHLPLSPRSPRNKSKHTVPAWQDQTLRVKRPEPPTRKLHRDATIVYGYNDIVEQLRLDRLRRLQDLYKQEIRQGDGRQGEPKTAESKKDMLTATTVKGTRRLDIRSPNMCAESPRLTTFGTWAQLRQQQLQKLQQKQQQQQKQKQQKQGQDRQHDRVIAIGEPMKKRATKKTVRVSSNGITTEEAATACGSPLAHDLDSMEVDTEPISRVIQAVDRGKSCARHASNPNKKDMGAAQSRIPYLLRRELEEASRRIEQVEASVALEWQEKFEDLSQAVCQFGMMAGAEVHPIQQGANS